MAQSFRLDEKGRETLGQLWRSLAGRMYGLAFSILREQRDSEDAVGEAFIKIAKSLPKLEGRPEKEIQGFCAVVVRNTAMDRLRRRRREKELFVGLEEGTAEPNGEFEFFEISELKEAIGCLSREQQETLLLVVYYGLSAAEAADILGVAKITVYKRLQTALNTLKGKLGNGGGQGER